MIELIDKHMKILERLAAKVDARPLGHAGVPAFRSRAYESAVYLSNHVSVLDKEQLSLAIELCDKYLISFSNDTGDYSGRWAHIKAGFEVRLESLVEEDELESPVEEDEDEESQDILVSSINRTSNIPIDHRCIPANCKFCTHYGYLSKETAGDNTNVCSTNAYLCENPNAERFGLLMSAGFLCRQAIGPGEVLMEYVVHVSAGMAPVYDYLTAQGLDADSIVSIQCRGDNNYVFYHA